MGQHLDRAREHAEAIARIARDRGLTIGAAESLTSGAIASCLGAATDASEWFRGAVVAYFSEVKYEVLGVEPGPVVNARTAEQMAVGARSLLGCDWAVAVTGAGGPGPEEGQPEGTVFVGIAGPDVVLSQHRLIDGDPEHVVERTCEVALAELLARLRA